MSIIDNFEPEIQKFIRENEKKLGFRFVGCLESDNALVFKNIGDIKVIDIVWCEIANCEMNKIPVEIDWNNFYGMRCSKCENNFFIKPESKNTFKVNISDEELDRYDI